MSRQTQDARRRLLGGVLNERGALVAPVSKADARLGRGRTLTPATARKEPHAMSSRVSAVRSCLVPVQTLMSDRQAGSM